MSTGIAAAGKLQALLDTQQAQPDLTRLQKQVAQIGEAVRTTVPPAMWSQILDKLDDSPALDTTVGTDADDLDEDCEPDNGYEEASDDW
ncbi:hypothetical protein [Aldersonia sp. NBC_00410]|uniref:hypothetical protein n=1 Tax=Aldersonia sp. NBC_00410 TaxID=2975954 RepID=UPI00224D5F8F|nr:hypothetical protein [Aldersonia sp. NBC_00410]